MRMSRRALGTLVAAVLGAATLLTAFVVLLVRLRRRLAPRTESTRDRDGPLRGAPPSPQAGKDSQPAVSGSGPLMHRRYVMDLSQSALGRDALMRAIKQHIAELSPASLAEFRKSVGSEQQMRVGDEYDITLLGPWNGRVRVTEVSHDSFALATLKGHPEAGQIRFSVRTLEAAGAPLRVTIESWARARDAAVEMAYSAFQFGKQVQSEVWVTFLQRIAKLAGTPDTPRVRITSEKAGS